MSNFEFLKKDDKKIIILSHIKPDSELPRKLGISHPEKPMKLNDSTKSYLGHLLEIKDDEILNELIEGFNQALTDKSVQTLNIRKTFTTKGDRFWICDDGLVLCTRKGYTGADTWAKLEGKYTYCVQTRNDLYGYLGLVGEPEFKKFIREWNKYGGEK